MAGDVGIKGMFIEFASFGRLGFRFERVWRGGNEIRCDFSPSIDALNRVLVSRN